MAPRRDWSSYGLQGCRRAERRSGLGDTTGSGLQSLVLALASGINTCVSHNLTKYLTAVLATTPLPHRGEIQAAAHLLLFRMEIKLALALSGLRHPRMRLLVKVLVLSLIMERSGLGSDH